MRRSNLSMSLASAFVIALVVIVSSAYLSLDNLRLLKSAHFSSLRRASIVDQIDRLLYTIKDAETSSRAYLITGEQLYLESFDRTLVIIEGYRADLRPSLLDDKEQRDRLAKMDSLVSRKLGAMKTRVEVMRTQGFEQARKLFLTITSPSVMEEIANVMRDEEDRERFLQREADRKLEVELAKETASDSILAGITTLIFILFFIVLNRQMASRALSEKALQVSEDRYYTLIENSLDGIFVSSLERTLLYVNPAGCAMMGRPEDELIGKDSLSFIHPDDLPTTETRLRDLVLGKEKSMNIEARIRSRKGFVRWIEASASKTKFGNDQDVIIASYRDVTDRKTSELARQESEERFRAASVRLQGLSRKLLELQETERQKLAVELHDEMGQVLTAVQMNLQSIQPFDDPRSIPARLHESTKLVGQLLEQARNLSLELRPLVLDHLGLVSALRWYVDRLAQRSAIKMEFKSTVNQERFTPQIEITCFRIAQEALTNVLRHSHAKRVNVELVKDSHNLVLTISDDGIGIDTEQVERKRKDEMNFGLVGMRERVSLLNGTFAMQSKAGSGTTITVCVPLTSNSANPVS